MEVKSYKKIRGNLYRVTLDDGNNYELYDDVILKYELLIDKRIDEKKLTKILEENEVLDAYYKALKYLGIKMRTRREVEFYLKKKDLSSKAIKKAIDKLEKEGYINSKMYVEAYVNDSINLGTNGPVKIKNALLKLGIDEGDIDEYLNNVDSSTWTDKIEKFVLKKAKTNKVGISLFKNKVYSDLISLGYHSDDIKPVLEAFDLNTDDAFLKEADKVFGKLSTKYSGTELKLRFKSKMFTKAFDSEKISDYLNKKGL